MQQNLVLAETPARDSGLAAAGTLACIPMTIITTIIRAGGASG